MNEDKVIHEFKKNSREVVRASVREWNGQSLFDIRVYYEASDGAWKPGSKGICLRLDHLPEFKKAVERIIEETSTPQ